jgi:hypothetical protein
MILGHIGIPTLFFCDHAHDQSLEIVILGILQLRKSLAIA